MCKSLMINTSLGCGQKKKTFKDVIFRLQKKTGRNIFQHFLIFYGSNNLLINQEKKIIISCSATSGLQQLHNVNISRDGCWLNSSLGCTDIKVKT